jgi:hypothetical protein
MNAIAARARSSEGGRILRWLSVGLTLQAALTIGHFAHGAHVYDDPSRYHVVAPALIALAASLIAAALYARRPSRASLVAVVLVAGAPFVALFGVYHGGVNHLAKLFVFAAGASPERLEEIFDSPDFAVPNDVVFEATGVSTFLVGLAVAWLLVRLVRSNERRSSAGT